MTCNSNQIRRLLFNSRINGANITKLNFEARPISTYITTENTFQEQLENKTLLGGFVLYPGGLGVKMQIRRSSSTQTAQSSLGPNFTKAQAVTLIEKLTVEERMLFLKELKKVVPIGKGLLLKPSRGELRQLAYHNSLPFIGFGFLDNLIMILAGEYIDLTLGVSFGISTMAAAALGNTISDMMGVGSAWYVESWATRLGAHPPDLTVDQLETTDARVAANLGRCLGVMLGCLIGMFPLLFLTQGEKEEEKAPGQEEKINVS